MARPDGRLGADGWARSLWRRRRIYPNPNPDTNLDICIDPDALDVCIDPDASTDRSVNVGFGRSDRSLRLLEDHQYQWLQHLRR